MRTKRQIIEAAFDEIGVTSLDQQPEDLQTGLDKLDALVAQRAGEGGSFAYPIPTQDLDEESGIPMDLVRGIISQLAVDLAPGYGRQPLPATVTAAQQGRSLMIRKVTGPMRRETDYRSVPAGAGHKRRRTVLRASDTNILPEDRA